MAAERKHERYDYQQDVELVTDGGASLSARLMNFSLGGAFLSVERPPAFGSRVFLHIRLPGVQGSCEIPSYVRWVKEGHGIGIQFESTRPIEVWALSKLIRKLKNEGSAR